MYIDFVEKHEYIQQKSTKMFRDNYMKDEGYT